MATPTVVSRIQNRRGTQDQFNALYPPGYTGIGPFPTGTDIADYPNVLFPGEIALCTDTGRVYIGNLNSEYFEVGTGSAGGPLTPLVIELAPSPGVFTAIPELDFDPTSFFTLAYSVTDVIDANWNTPGITLSKNGELQVTYISGTNTATLTDSSTELNSTAFNISFIAEYDSLTEMIVIKYSHDFPTPLQFSTTSVIWQQFI